MIFMKTKTLLALKFIGLFLIFGKVAYSQNSQRQPQIQGQTHGQIQPQIPGQEYQVGTGSTSEYKGDAIEPKGKKVRVWNTSGPVPVGRAPSEATPNNGTASSLPTAVFVNTDQLLNKNSKASQ